MSNQEPASPPRMPGQEGIYVAVLRLRREAANQPSTRADALHLRRLARDFDRGVAEVRARYTSEPEPAAVADLRAELAAKQRLALAAIAGRFFKFVGENWKQSSVLCFAIFSLVGYGYAYYFFEQFGISINPYLQGIEDLALIGFLKGELPLAILLLLAIWVMSIHYAAQSAGCKQVEIATSGAATRWVSWVILANSPVAIAGAIGVAAILIIGGVPYVAHEAATASDQDALQVRIDRDDKPILVKRLLGSTSNYLFMLLPGDDDAKGMVVARSIVRCIGPQRSIKDPVQPDIYGVPPCDVVGATTPPPLAAATVPCPACQESGHTSRSTHRRAIAALLGCEVEDSKPRFFETFDFKFGSDMLFEADDVARDCEPRMRPKECARRKLDDFLASALFETAERRAFIVGFASHKGRAIYNLDLSERRAAFVHQLTSAWPDQTFSYAVGENYWMPALQSRTKQVALVVVCKPAPLHESSLPPAVVMQTSSMTAPAMAHE